MINAKLNSSIIFARLVSGLIIMVYCFGHMINHSLGIISVESMDKFLEYFMIFWRAPVIYYLMPISILIHALAALFTFLHRRSMRGLTRAEITQFVLGLLLPLLLFMHISYGRVTYDMTGRLGYYTYFFDSIEKENQFTFFFIFYAIMLAMVWVHGCLGIHRWLSLKSWYNRLWLFFYTLAIMPYVTSMIGVAVGYREAVLRKFDSSWMEMVAEKTPWLNSAGLPMSPDQMKKISDDAVMPVYFKFTMAFILSVIIGVILRFIWLQIEKRQSNIEVSFSGGEKVRVSPGSTILEASRLAGISHAAICGGNGRCSTCRTRILSDPDLLIPPASEESKVLHRISAAPNIRLACQVKLHQDIQVHPLLMQANPSDGHQRPTYADGEEVDVTLLFADLRGFTQMANQRLPFDVVFILNQYFELMGEAIETSGGYLDKFIGDGIMAIFGMHSGSEIGAKQAIGAAIKMGQQLEVLNSRLEDELDRPLEIGIGLHRGNAIVGNMGYGDAMAVTAIGDTVNVASRLEGACKTLGVQLVVSEEVLQAASVEFPDVIQKDVEVRGSAKPVSVFPVDNASTLKPVVVGA